MNPTQFKKAFFRRVDGFAALQQLLDLLPDVAFFVKDRKCRFVMNNLRGVECCGAATEEETIGKLGHEFFSEERVALYLEQDRRVLETGEPIINAVCPAPERGVDALILYSKVPLRDRRGRVIGLAGIHREVRGQPSPKATLGRIAHVAEIIHARYAEPLSVRQLAAEARLSRSQFHRVFHRVFGAKPHEYLLRVRVHAACRMLSEGDVKVTQVALKAGFYDHSHFSRAFRRVMGVSPLVYRRRQASRRLFS